jgi:hypothetical protein
MIPEEVPIKPGALRANPQPNEVGRVVCETGHRQPAAQANPLRRIAMISQDGDCTFDGDSAPRSVSPSLSNRPTSGAAERLAGGAPSDRETSPALTEGDRRAAKMADGYPSPGGGPGNRKIGCVGGGGLQSRASEFLSGTQQLPREKNDRPGGTGCMGT